MTESHNASEQVTQHNSEIAPVWRYVIRILWIAIQIILVLWIGQKGAQFFYQRF